jgi:cytochrome c
MASADAGAGAGVFRRCSACHVLEAGANRVGPYLYGVVGRDIASASGFNYSAALSGIDGVWDYEHLFQFIRNPREYAPGTAMAFAGISNPEEIANLIAYMEAEAN